MAEDLVKRLREDIIEISGWGAGNEAARVKAAADLIEQQAASLAAKDKEIAEAALQVRYA